MRVKMAYNVFYWLTGFVVEYVIWQGVCLYEIRSVKHWQYNSYLKYDMGCITCAEMLTGSQLLLYKTKQVINKKKGTKNERR